MDKKQIHNLIEELAAEAATQNKLVGPDGKPDLGLGRALIGMVLTKHRTEIVEAASIGTAFATATTPAV